jgi:hypothetical protein
MKVPLKPIKTTILQHIDPLVGNDSVNTYLWKRTHAKIGRLLLGNRSIKSLLNNREAVFSVWYVLRGYKGTKKVI